MSTRKIQLLRRAAGKPGRNVAITREEKALRDVLENAGNSGGGYDLIINKVSNLSGRRVDEIVEQGSVEAVKTKILNGEAVFVEMYEVTATATFCCPVLCVSYDEETYSIIIKYISEYDGTIKSVWLSEGGEVSG